MLTVKGYPIEMEVDGYMAMFRDPSTGDTPKSYPAPTMSACKSIFNAIAALINPQTKIDDASLYPYKVEICRPILYTSTTFNSHSPAGKQSTKNKKGATQTFCSSLLNVCYKIYGISFPRNENMGTAHYLQEKFIRRLKKGRCFSRPFLGIGEYFCDYYGPLRPETKVEPINEYIGVMPLLVFNDKGQYSPVFCSSATIERGVLNYAERIEKTERLIKVTWPI